MKKTPPQTDLFRSSDIPRETVNPEHISTIVFRVLEEAAREDLKIIAVEPGLYPEVVI